MFQIRIISSVFRKKCFICATCLALVTLCIIYITTARQTFSLVPMFPFVISGANDTNDTSHGINTSTTPVPDVYSKYNNNVTYDFDVESFLIKHNVTDDSPKKVFLWYYPTTYTLPVPKPSPLRLCPDMPCLVTTNKDFFNKADVILFSAVDMQAGRDTLTIPPNRTNSDQLFILHCYEPQLKAWVGDTSFRKPGWKSAINLTMGYRSDTDIFAPYGKVVPRSQPVQKNYTSSLASKTGLIAWMVSSCHSEGKREKYVEALKKNVTVDVYGICGRHKCERGKDEDCLREIGQRYKFYLSFESAICPDYVSEKFFHYYKLDLVLVYRGTDDIYKYAPNGTYINVKDFSSAEDLAKHLLYLNSHTEEYIKILEAKNKYLALYEYYPHLRAKGYIEYVEWVYQAVPFCDLCRKLWEKDPSIKKTIPDLLEWFDKGNCKVI